jgi:hypothetical protein
MTKISYLLLYLFAVSCNNSNLILIEKASYPNLKEERLGQSTYYVKFPSTMFIEEARGKEGQLGYGLWQVDSIKRYESPSGFIEIEHGKPIGWKPDCDISVEKVRSNFLDGITTWKICKNENGSYYSAITNHGKLRLEASSRTRPGLDSMIAIISTLSSR